jgi:hypothetical protein
MNGRIAADSDAYGKYARLSALADYLEVRALRQQSLSRAGLADLIFGGGLNEIHLAAAWRSTLRC